jgi:alkanesulfonate monooxygenase SsuD/methylene tetrahydromethanopterin reductase-like flavin-dependent oxidoreductase (luciferase family)
MALALAGGSTDRVLLGTAVVPTWPRHPVVAAQQAATANAACGGRFRFGVGPSHPPVMRMYGIEDDRPLGHLEEWLAIVRALLHDGKVAHDGDRYRVTAFLDVETPGPPPLMLGALHPRLARLAGASSDGALSWLVSPGWLRDVVTANVRAGAEAAGRPAPPVVAELPCYVATDRAAVLEAARRDLAIYPLMPAYADVLAHVLGRDPGEVTAGGWTDDCTDAVVVWGDRDTIRARVVEYLDAGADEVVLSPYGCGEDPEQDLDDALEVLGDIARS